MVYSRAMVDDPRIARLLAWAEARVADVLGGGAPRLLVVDASAQELHLFADGRLRASFPVSTAAAGLGGAAGSFRTPPGVHVIAARIGDGAQPGAVFESREPTGAVWRGEPAAADLILTRILTLDGREAGVNRGPGCDSLERYIYIHGTNHEDALGRPQSHGCIRLANRDVVALFDQVMVGDPVVVLAGPPALPSPARSTFHYAGVAGSGMSALAQFQAFSGGRATGSDRTFDRGGAPAIRAALERAGVAIAPQDGSGVTAATDALIVSTAVEATVPDVGAALARRVPIFHRSELLAALVAAHRTIAVAGTSGKSTVVAMIFELLRAAGRDPSLVSGGDVRALTAAGYLGNAWAGRSAWLVVEADESDGSLVRYAPAIGVVLNLDKDHKEESEVRTMFEMFRARTREAFVVGEAANLEGLRAGALVFGHGPAAAVRAEDVTLAAGGSEFTVDGVRFRVPVAGRHNVENALAALAACRAAGIDLAALAAPLAAFRGVGRRFELLGTAGGVTVVDDFAHNPAKIRAALATAHLAAPRRVLAVYQPHGFGPTRFLRHELAAAFAAGLDAADRLWLLDIFYAGGTATRDISSADLAAAIRAGGRDAAAVPDRATLVAEIAAMAAPGDLVLVMGARDPSLTDLCRVILARLGAASA
jgi:UDP-N-acetylmuramate--alanine ligase